MRFLDDVVTLTPEVSAIKAALKKVASQIQGDWDILRNSHLVSAYENKTQEIHMFASHDPDEMAQELVIRDREVFTGDTWS
jgi:hypothetical protein